MTALLAPPLAVIALATIRLLLIFRARWQRKNANLVVFAIPAAPALLYWLLLGLSAQEGSSGQTAMMVPPLLLVAGLILSGVSILASLFLEKYP